MTETVLESPSPGGKITPLGTSQDWIEISWKFKSLHDIFDHAWSSGACVDVSQCWLMTETVFVLETQLQVEKLLHWGYLRNGKRYHRNSKTYPHIFDHARLNGLIADIVRCRLSTTDGKYHGKPAPGGKIASLVLASLSKQVPLCRALMEMWV